MAQRRKIKTNEQKLILFLLKKAGLNHSEFPINSEVEEYEGYVMGSIGIGDPNLSPYDGDIIQVKYIDSDHINVVITLTKDANNQLLDLDFWKEDFSKLIKYPSPEDLF